MFNLFGSMMNSGPRLDPVEEARGRIGGLKRVEERREPALPGLAQRARLPVLAVSRVEPEGTFRSFHIAFHVRHPMRPDILSAPAARAAARFSRN